MKTITKECVEQQHPIPTLNHKQKLAIKEKGSGVLSKVSSLEQRENTVQATAGCSVWLGGRGVSREGAAVGAGACPKVLKEEAHSTQGEGERGNRMEQIGGF